MFLIRNQVIFSILLVLAGCGTVPQGVDRKKQADELAASRNWKAHLLETTEFSLQAYTPENFEASDGVLRVYIEGDGLAWISRNRPSSDPTPLDPVALELALGNPEITAVYLARPCQFDGRIHQRCNSHYWTSGRYSSPVLNAMNQAVSDLKMQSNAKSLELVGYSGGGAVALILAALRDDVSKVITVAGNLDTERWTEFHGVSPLKDSLNPASFVEQLRGIQQVHYVGDLDEVFPAHLTREFVSRFESTSSVKMVVVKGFDHYCCWNDYKING